MRRNKVLPPVSAEDAELEALGVPKHKRLLRILEQKIHSGEYASGQKLPTEKELMQQTRYSYATVSQALRALAGSGLVTRKRGCGTFVADEQVRQQVRAAADPVALTLAHFHGGIKPGFHPYFSLLLEGFLAAAAEHGMAMKFLAAPTGVLEIRPDFLKRHGIAGFSTSAARRSELEAALAAGIPVVDLSGWTRDLPVDRVETDLGLGTRLALRHLKNLGHQRIAVIDTRRKDDVQNAAAEVFDCLPQDAPIDAIYVEGWDMAAAERAYAALKALPSRATAAYVGDDFLLMNLLRVMQREGLSVPRDLAIVGRGSPMSSEFIGPMPITMVEFDPAAIARAAVKLLVERIRGNEPPGRVARIEPRLVIGKSCGAS